ncbi:MAG: EamA family transporter [Alphaproteobacteria bacterium]
MRPKDLALVLAIVLVWGVNFVVIKWGIDDLPPMLLGTLRFVFVAFPAILFVPKPHLPFRWIALYGLTISFGQFSLLFAAIYVGMPAGLASVVLQAQALFTLIFGVFLLRETISLKQAYALITSSVGLIIIAAPGDYTHFSILGFFLTIGAAASWGIGNIVNKKINEYGSVNMLSLVVWSALVPILPFAMLSIVFDGLDNISYSLQNIKFKSICSILYLVCIASLFGYAGWGKLLSRYPASRISQFALLIPAVGCWSAWIFLGEALSYTKIIGAIFVMGGLAVSTIPFVSLHTKFLPLFVKKGRV